MSRSTEELIAALAADIRPVKRLKPPMVRAGLWLAAVAVPAGLALALFADWPTFMARISDPRVAAEVAAALLTGVLGVIAAFHLALPDRSRRWALAPLAPAAAWLAVSGLGCWQDWVRRGPAGLQPGHSVQCVLFVLGVSIPVGGFLLWSLARAKPLEPVSTAAVGGLGAAAISAFLLQFFHPFEVTLSDLGLHLAAVLVVIAASTLTGRRAFAPA